VSALALLLLLGPQAAQPVSPPAPPDLKAIARLVEKGQLDAAERQLRRAVAGGAGAEALDLLGVVLAKQGKAQEAERRFRQALAARPAFPEARQHLARLYLDQQRENEALSELRKAAQAEPLERDLGLTLAGAELKEGRPEAAARLFESVAVHHDSVQALLQLARLQSGRKDARGALESLQRAAALAPNAEEVLSAQAQLSLGLRAPVPAIVALEPLTRMCPTVAQYQYLLGVALMQAGDVPAAVEPLQQADRLEPNRVLTLVALGLALNARKLYAEAKPYAQHALELEPDNPEAAAALAEAEHGLGELEAAEGHAQRALARVADHATANLVLGLVRMAQGRYAEARDSFEKAVAGDPASPRAHYQLSLAYARLDDPANAQRQVDLYQQKMKDIEKRVEELRKATGLSKSSGGMFP
jgi:tetratricopeptide (TPR) repeat protein